MKSSPWIALVSFLVFLPLHSTHALGLGGRAGLSVDPDQFVLGAQATLGAAMPGIEFAPGVDFGFGKGVGVTVINADFRLHLPSLPKVSPNLYAGAGPALVSARPEGHKRTTRIGGSLLAGLRIPINPITSYNLEARFGVTKRTPDFKFMAGLIFGL